MSRRVFILWIAGTLGALGAAAVGCANDDGPSAPAPSADDSGPRDALAEADAAIDSQTPDVLLPPRACSYDHWCPTPLPTSEDDPKTYDLRGVWVAPNHEAFAASNGGEVLAWNGSAWREIYVGAEPFVQIWGASASELWLVTDAQGIVRGTKSAADTWTFAPVPIPGGAISLWGASASEIWAAGSGALFRWNGEAAGERWTRVTLPRRLPGALGGGGVFALWGSGPNDFWARGYEWASDCEDCGGPVSGLLLHWDPSGVATESDAGADGGGRPGVWKSVAIDPKANGDLYQAKPSGSAGGEAQILCVSRSCGSVLHATPVGGSPDQLTYSEKPVVEVGSRRPAAIWGSRANDIWLVGAFGSVRHFDGTAWSVSRITNTDTPISRYLYSVHGVTEGTQSDVWIVGTNVTLHRTGAP